MNYFSYARNDPGHGRQGPPEPRPAEPGRWPKLEAALAVVNRDVLATLPGQDALVLMAEPPWQDASPGGIDRGQVYVAMADGRWHGNAVNACDLGEGDPPEPDDAATVLAVVADAAQSTLMELLWKVWPTCWEHGIGLHPGPVGTADDEDPEEADADGPPVWWCRGGRDGEGHDVAPVGELAGALPGKQRRALRRGERRRDGRIMPHGVGKRE
ncbi:hypothetical protein ACIRU2_18530 [Streptomyces sp. NPDC101169]|uniref:hypothetical protein n=1 Tax=Streptomyces sp. NPDC101169 TaxID=3366121 RepID=UPI0037F86721